MRFLSLKSIFIKIIGGLLYLTIAVFAAFMSYKQGFSQYYAKVASSSQDVSKFSQALEIDPTNPETYKLRGLSAQQNRKYQAAINDFNQAIDLRPNDYLLWLQLGFANNMLKDFEKAKTAYERSIELAPNYFQPRQYLGFLYLKNNKPEQAFTYLSQAAAIKPTLLPQVLQIAYQTFSGNPIAIENAVQINSVAAKKEMASFFIKNNIVSDKTIAFLNSDELEEKDKNQFINQLIKMKNYKLAFSIWVSKAKNKNIPQNLGKNLIMEGDFENSISTDEIGFGWQIQNIPNVSLKLDNKNPYSGSTTLAINFNGNSDTSIPIISQLIIVKPNQQYNLTFAARAEELVTGGLPTVTILDADSVTPFYQSAPISSANNQWQKYSTDFKTNNQTKALIIKVQRQNCKENPCPVFGKLWLDEFIIREF